MRALRLWKAELQGIFKDLKKRKYFEIRGHVNEQFQILHLRGDDVALFEMKSMFFDNGAEVRSISSSEFQKNCDFSVCVRGLASVPNGFLFQHTLEAFLPRFQSTEELLKNIGKSTRSTLNTASSMKLELEQGKTIEDLVFFYEKMLVPFAKMRHGEKFWLPDIEEFKAVWPDNLYLYFVQKEGERMAGELFLHTKGLNQLTEWRFGINEECSSNQKLVSICNNWMTLQFHRVANEMGIDRISLGQVVSRLDDGILRFKCRWKADFKRIPGYPWYLLKFHTDKSRQILKTVPLIVWQKDIPTALMSISDLKDFETFSNTLRSAHFEGLQVYLYIEKNMDENALNAELGKSPIFKHVFTKPIEELNNND